MKRRAEQEGERAPTRDKNDGVSGHEPVHGSAVLVSACYRENWKLVRGRSSSGVVRFPPDQRSREAEDPL